MFPRFENIRQVHVEITTDCNAACPMCARNVKGGRRNPLFKVTSLSVADFSRIITPSVAKQLDKVTLCGNYGDPCMSPSCMGIAQYLVECNPKLKIGIHTNGGMQDPAWWADMGKIIKKPSYVRFSIDGLEHTNHLYRQRVRWGALMAHVKAFIASGGNAQWDYIVFQHNEHQVDTARDLATHMGFSQFFMKKTARFFSKARGVMRDTYPVQDAKGDVVRELLPPRSKQYVNTAVAEGTGLLIAKHGSMDAYCKGAAVDCKAAKDRSVYLSAEGLVFPCCWLASHTYDMIPDSDRETLHILENMAPGGMASIDANVSSIHNIVNGVFFQELLPAAWRSGSGVPRLRTCAMTCGSEMNWFEQQCSLTPGQRVSSQPAQDIEDIVATMPKPPSRKVAASSLVILYGSHTGTAEAFAQTLGREGRRFGIPVTVMDVAEYPLAEGTTLAKENAVAMIFATYGEGDPTDSAKAMFRWMMDKEREKEDFTALHFTVFGLGDSHYKQFNQMGKSVDARLGGALKARRFHALGLGDASNNLEDAFDEWKAELWHRAGPLFGVTIDAIEDPPPPVTTARFEDNPQTLPYHHHNNNVANSVLEPTQRHPAYARITVARELLVSPTDGTKSTKHFELDLSETRISFQAGDHAGILPCNPDHIVWEYAHALGLSDEVLDSAVILINTAAPLPAKVSTHTALKWYVDLCGAPRKSALRGFARFCTDSREKDDFLNHLQMTETSRVAFKQLGLRTVHGYLCRYPSCQVPLAVFLELMPRIAPRYFSVASDGLKTARSLHLTVALVPSGLCSGYLAGLVAGDRVPMFVRRSSFHLPVLAKDRPIVMIGPGTGVAPLIGFLHRRAAWKDKGHVIGRAMLFFGCRRKGEDFIHRDVMEHAVATGVLTNLSTAFSREQAHKVYVQDSLQEHGEDVWSIIREGGNVYVCGDAKNMARDVEGALVDIIVRHGGIEETDAVEMLSQMERGDRYIKDVWST